MDNKRIIALFVVFIGLTVTNPTVTGNAPSDMIKTDTSKKIIYHTLPDMKQLKYRIQNKANHKIKVRIRNNAGNKTLIEDREIKPNGTTTAIVDAQQKFPLRLTITYTAIPKNSSVSQKEIDLVKGLLEKNQPKIIFGYTPEGLLQITGD